MTINEAIAQLDNLKPNVFNEQVKRQWLSEVDSRLLTLHNYYVLTAAEQAVIDAWSAYDIDTDGDTELIAVIPFTDIYLHYMFAKIDYLQSDIQRYSNGMTLYEDMYVSYANEFNRLHSPLTSSIVAFSASDTKTDWTENI